MAQRQAGFDQAGHSGCCIKVSDVGFYRSDGTMPDTVTRRAKPLLQRRNFDRVTQIGARAVAFDIIDTVSRHTRPDMRRCDGLGLT